MTPSPATVMPRMATHWTAEPYAAKPCEVTVWPPVDTVVKAWFAESQTGIPAVAYAAPIRTVSAM